MTVAPRIHDCCFFGNCANRIETPIILKPAVEMAHEIHENKRWERPLTGTMQLERQERGIHSAEASTFHQRSRAFPCRRDPTPFRGSEPPIEIRRSRLVNPRFCGMNSALHLHRSGLKPHGNLTHRVCQVFSPSPSLFLYFVCFVGRTALSRIICPRMARPAHGCGEESFKISVARLCHPWGHSKLRLKYSKGNSAYSRNCF